MASQAPPQPPLLPAVRAVFGSLKLASLRGKISTDGVSFPEKPRVAGLFKDVLQQKGGIE